MLTRTSSKRWTETEKTVKKMIKTSIFIFFIILPFLSITNIIGVNTFLDSFENPEYYLVLENNDNYLTNGRKDSEFLLIQKQSHPEFNLKKSDLIIYCQNNGYIACEKINSCSIGGIKIYHISNNDSIESQLIFESQIIGKVVNIIDNNIWNSISIKFWDISINSLNLNNFIVKC
jgi:hypothetical protein